ncbi:oligosaccharide flippase family protein [Agaribacter marinus]|uniref:Teichuronic acid biosynthesis protein TuaB n=1 Tax=Agaribacter marinus TaxID=1431249 RepID=A0AA37WJ76_9ALTE|nr:oligosaccharide flippase family protein [Agaribacter marinus]GLR72886.1 teichuronic acid biosynthesis protein TuaB [Agaribacter marinus]
MAAKGRLFKLFWVFTEKFGVVFLSVISFLVFAKLLTPTELGIGIFILSIFELLSFFYSSVLDSALISFKKINDRLCGTVFWSSMLICALTAPILFFSLHHYLNDPTLTLTLFIAAVYLPVQISTRIHIATLRKSGNFKSLAKRTLIGKVIGMSGAIFLAFQGFGSLAIVAQAFIMSAVSSLMLFVAHPLRLPLVFDKTLAYDLLRVGLPVSGKAFSFKFFGNGIIIAIEATLGAAAVGIYNFANRLVYLPRDAILGAIVNYAQPVFANRKNNNQDIDTFFVDATRLALFFIMPLFAGFGIVGPELVSLIFGEKWEKAYPLLGYISLVVAASFYFIFLPSYLVAVKKTIKGMIGEIVGSGIALVAYMLLYKYFGLFSFVIGLMLRLFIVCIVNFKVTTNVSQVSFSTLMVSFLKPSLCTAFMVIVLLVAKQYLVGVVSLPELIVYQIIIAVMSYLTLLSIVERRFVSNFKGFLSRK